jgi:hypothetical protein
MLAREPLLRRPLRRAVQPGLDHHLLEVGQGDRVQPYIGEGGHDRDRRDGERVAEDRVMLDRCAG